MAKQEKNNSASKDAELNKAAEEEAVAQAKAEVEAKEAAEAKAEAEAEAKADKPVSFTVDKKKYTFKVKSFRYKGGLITAEDASKNEELLSILVETKSFIIKEA